ncbi:MAG: arsenite efflux transporter metallochaperone ArsD [Balneolaceae bacterium]|nr:arsenite efflux transporter metallochaperone ArsD [Balneolaceae bacterium]
MTIQTDKQTKIEVYDPPMCCSTGVCGPEVDQKLVDFNNDLKWLKSQGVEVQRYNLGQEAEAFKNHPEVITRIQKMGTDILPIIVVNGKLELEGDYPTRALLIDLCQLDEKSKSNEKGAAEKPHESIYNARINELVAIAASLASNCEPCLKHHYKEAEKLGIAKEDLARTLQMAQQVKESPASDMVQLANKLLGVSSQPSNGCAPGSGCC